MRYAGEVLAVTVAVAVGGWYARAPGEAQGRAAYLCAPVATATRTAARLEAALSDHDQVVPPIQARLPDLATDCVRLVLRLRPEEDD